MSLFCVDTRSPCLTLKPTAGHHRHERKQKSAWKNPLPSSGGLQHFSQTFGNGLQGAEVAQCCGIRAGTPASGCVPCLGERAHGSLPLLMPEEPWPLAHSCLLVPPARMRETCQKMQAHSCPCPNEANQSQRSQAAASWHTRPIAKPYYTPEQD